MCTIRDSKFIGQRLRQLRERAGLSQSEVGALLDVSYQQVQKYERGINQISVEKLQRLAQALMVPINVFFEDAPLSEPQAQEQQEQIEEGISQYLPPVLSRQERDVLRWFRAIRDEELRLCLTTLIKLIAQAQH